MNKRVVEIELNINAVRVNQVEKATQGDTNTHFLHLTFDSEVELEGYNLQVTYMPIYPETVPYVDVYTDLKQELEILIPNILLRRTGNIGVNFALSKGEEILTVNKSFTFEVIKTINGSSITAFPEGNLKLTLAQQIEKVTQLLEEAEEKVNDYNDSVIEKTNEFNENARTKTEEFDNNYSEKIEEFNDEVTKITTEANEGISDFLSIAYNNLDSVGTDTIEKVKTGINTAKDSAVSGAKEEINNYIETTTKPGIDSYVEEKKEDLKGDPGEQGLPGRDLLNEMQGTIGMKFDESLTYLNDTGTKKVGFCYLDKLTPGIFECIKETTTTVNDSACFVNFSNKEISDKLGNLSGYKLVKEFTTTEINSTVEVFNYPEIVDNKYGDNYFTEILVTAHYHNSIYGNIFAGAIKLATVPLNQNIGATIYKKQADKFVVFDNSNDTLWRNHLLADIKDINITFKVFVLKITL